MTVKKGTWVEIQDTILKADDRTANIPEETKKVPYLMRVRGFLLEDAEFGDEVKIKTMIGRELKGKLHKSEPAYSHNFGKTVPELLKIGIELQEELREINS